MEHLESAANKKTKTNTTFFYISEQVASFSFISIFKSPISFINLFLAVKGIIFRIVLYSYTENTFLRECLRNATLKSSLNNDKS